MQQEGETSDTSFTSTMTLTKMGLSNVPQRFILPPSQRPNSGLGHHSTTNLPIIDLSNLNNPSHRARTIDDISTTCKKLGFFQVIYYIFKYFDTSIVSYYELCTIPRYSLKMTFILFMNNYFMPIFFFCSSSLNKDTPGKIFF